MANHFEWSWTQEGLKIFAQGWSAPQPKGVVCIVHGFNEHSGRYADAAGRLVAAGYSVLAYDEFGHGQTEGKRGHAPSYEAMLDSIKVILAEAETRYPGLPKFLWGHSMGGGEVLNYLLKRNPKLAGAVATVVAGDDVEPEEVKKYNADPYNHGKITAGMFFGFFNAGQWALAHAAELKTPLLLMHGTADRLTSPEGTKEFAARAPKDLVTLKLWDGYFHEMHNEPMADRTAFFAYLINWLNGRVQGK